MLFVIEVDNDGFKIYDSAGNLIDPAKDQSVQSVLTALNAIKNTDGVKKITDPLPAGTNEIGKVAQGTRAAASGGWPHYVVDSSGNVVGVVLDADGPVYRLQTQAQLQTHSKGTTPVGAPTSESIDANKTALHVTILKNPDAGHPDADVRIVDDSGNPVGIILDGVVRRFQTDSKVAKGASDLVHLDALDTASGKGRLTATLYTPEGEAVALGSVSSNPSSIKNDFVKSGPSESLLVNGSVTPVVFTYDADASHDISIQEVKFVLASNSITFGSDYFGASTGPLTNGLLVEVIAGGNTGTVYNLKQNESFVNFASPGGFEWVVSSKDMMSSSWLVGGGLKLIHGTSDKIKVTVRDNLSAAGVYFKCFVKGNLLG